MVCSLIILLTLYFTLCLALLNTLSAAFVEEITDAIAINCVQKRSHLHFYFHDIVSGKSPSAVRVAGPPNSSIFDFGNLMMVDDALTEGPKLTSKLVGRAQGFYAMASQNEASLLMVMNFGFMEALLNTISGAFIEESREAVVIKRDGKTTHLHFYFHDILSGKNPSAIKIAGPSKSTIFNFGNTMMIDDALTEGPALESKLVGRAQGFYALAAQNEIAMLMVMNFVFTEGEYKGSTLSILGRNPVGDDVREMPVVGGSGVFRQAHGYALAHTVLFDPNTGDATVEYNVYVSHFQPDANLPAASLARHGMKPGQHALFFVFLLFIFVFGLNNSFTSNYV
ncbi:hypothetical protein I3842_14G007600 [Carya illinoinensis]|uniref:Dirigent protein n=1 Tax=Carya illinoinensis TaxID=32201 RepID=A0A922A8Z2_CARIL|nr:hypothetical protein I3842_14G007600 [Carya illinoinensis]